MGPCVCPGDLLTLDSHSSTVTYIATLQVSLLYSEWLAVQDHADSQMLRVPQQRALAVSRAQSLRCMSSRVERQKPATSAEKNFLPIRTNLRGSALLNTPSVSGLTRVLVFLKPQITWTPEATLGVQCDLC